MQSLGFRILRHGHLVVRGDAHLTMAAAGTVGIVVGETVSAGKEVLTTAHS